MTTAEPGIDVAIERAEREAREASQAVELAKSRSDEHERRSYRQSERASAGNVISQSRRSSFFQSKKISYRDESVPPTRADLLPDPKVKAFTPASEWEPLLNGEVAVLATVREWLGGERFDAVPYDLLMCFLRGYAYRQDWAETVYVELSEALDWRDRHAASSALAHPPPHRARFEDLNESGPIGHDQEGHIIELVKLGRLKVAELFKHFDVEDILPHIVYSAEAKRACNLANSKARRKRIYKVVTVIDCAGLSSSVMGKQFQTLMRKTSEVLSGHYPESMCKTYIINGPFIVRAVWGVAKHMMHPISAAKFSFLGSDWKKVFARDGLIIDGGTLPDKVSGR